MMGSTRAARIAGIVTAASAISRNAAQATTYVAGSPAVMPNTNVDRRRRSQIPAPRPRTSPHDDESCALVEQGAEDGVPCGAERQPDADLVRPLIDDVGEQSVESDGRQRQGDDRHARHQDCAETRRRKDLRHVLLQGSDAGHGLGRIDVVNDAPNRGRLRQGIAARSHHEIRDVAGRLRVQQEHRRRGIDGRPVVADVPDDANHFSQRLVARLHEQTAPDHAAVAEVLPRKGLVHDQHTRAPGAVAPIEGAAVQNRNAHRGEVALDSRGRIRWDACATNRDLPHPLHSRNRCRRWLRGAAGTGWYRPPSRRGDSRHGRGSGRERRRVCREVAGRETDQP